MTSNYYPIVLDEREGSFSITNTGTAPSPCVITIVPRVSFPTMKIEGLSEDPIVLSQIAANDVVVIDGEQREFRVNGSLAWDKFDGWQFPHLEPGINTVKITNSNMMDIEVAYNARYI